MRLGIILLTTVLMVGCSSVNQYTWQSKSGPISSKKLSLTKSECHFLALKSVDDGNQRSNGESAISPFTPVMLSTTMDHKTQPRGITFRKVFDQCLEKRGYQKAARWG